MTEINETAFGESQDISGSVYKKGYTFSGSNVRIESDYDFQLYEVSNKDNLPILSVNNDYSIKIAMESNIIFFDSSYTHVMKPNGEIKLLNKNADGSVFTYIETFEDIDQAEIIPFTLNISSSALRLDIQTNVISQNLTVNTATATETNKNEFYVSLVAGEAFAGNRRDEINDISVNFVQKNEYGLVLDASINETDISGQWKVSYVIKEDSVDENLRNDNGKDFILTINMKHNDNTKNTSTSLVAKLDSQQLRDPIQSNTKAIENFNQTLGTLERLMFENLHEHIYNKIKSNKIQDSGVEINNPEFNIYADISSTFFNNYGDNDNTNLFGETTVFEGRIENFSIDSPLEDMRQYSDLIQHDVPGFHNFTIVATDNVTDYIRTFTFTILPVGELSFTLFEFDNDNDNDNDNIDLSLNHTKGENFILNYKGSITGINQFKLIPYLRDNIKFNVKRFHSSDETNPIETTNDLSLSLLNELLSDGSFNIGDKFEVDISYNDNEFEETLTNFKIKNNIRKFTINIVGNPTNILVSYKDSESNKTVTKKNDFTLNAKSTEYGTPIIFSVDISGDEYNIDDISFNVTSEKSGYDPSVLEYNLPQPNFDISDNTISLYSVAETSYIVNINASDRFNNKYNLNFTVIFSNNRPVVFNSNINSYIFNIQYEDGIYKWPTGNNDNLIYNIIKDVSLNYTDENEQLKINYYDDFFTEYVEVKLDYSNNNTNETIFDYKYLKDLSNNNFSQDEIKNFIMDRNDFDDNDSLYNELFETIPLSKSKLQLYFIVFNSSGLKNEPYNIILDKSNIRIHTKTPTIEFPDISFNVEFNRAYISDVSSSILYPMPSNWLTTLTKDISINVLSNSVIQMNDLGDPRYVENKKSAYYDISINNYDFVIKVTAFLDDDIIIDARNVNNIDLRYRNKITIKYTIEETNREIPNQNIVSNIISNDYNIYKEDIPSPTAGVVIDKSITIKYYETYESVGEAKKYKVNVSDAQYEYGTAFENDKNVNTDVNVGSDYKVTYSIDVYDQVNANAYADVSFVIKQQDAPSPEFNLVTERQTIDISYSEYNSNYLDDIFENNKVTAWDTDKKPAEERNLELADISNIVVNYYDRDNSNNTLTITNISNNLKTDIPNIDIRARIISMDINFYVTNKQTTRTAYDDDPKIDPYKSKSATTTLYFNYTHNSIFTQTDISSNDEIDVDTSLNIIVNSLDYTQENIVNTISEFWNNSVISPYFGNEQQHTWTITTVKSYSKFLLGDFTDDNVSDIIQGTGQNLNGLKLLFNNIFKRKYPIIYSVKINTTDQYNNNDITQDVIFKITDDTNIQRFDISNWKDERFIFNVGDINKELISINGLFSYNVRFNYDVSGIKYDNYYKLDNTDTERLSETIINATGELNYNDSIPYPGEGDAGISNTNFNEYQDNIRLLKLPLMPNIIDTSVPGKYVLTVSTSRTTNTKLQDGKLEAPENLWKDIVFPNNVTLEIYIIDINAPKVLLNNDLSNQTFVIQKNTGDILTDISNDIPLAQAVDHYGNNLSNLTALDYSEVFVFINNIMRISANNSNIKNEYNIFDKSMIRFVTEFDPDEINNNRTSILLAGNLIEQQIIMGENERVVVEYIAVIVEGNKVKYSEPKYIIYDNDNNDNNNDNAVTDNINEILPSEGNLIFNNGDPSVPIEPLNVDITNPQTITNEPVLIDTEPIV